MRTILFSFILIILVSCGAGKSEKSLVGTWKPIELNMPKASETEKTDILTNATIEFTKDNGFISRFGEQKETGTYTYNEKTGELNTSSGTNQFEKYKVEWKEKNILLTNDLQESMLLKKQ